MPAPLLAETHKEKTTDVSTKPSPDEVEWDNGPKPREDPLEGFNRPMSAFNRALREYLLDPVVKLYKTVTPDAAEQALSRVASNLTEPFTIVGALIGGDPEGAGTATARFLINTTVGVGGLADVATEAGIEYCREDIGQGLAKQGVGTGPHIVAPILGPSNVRDLPSKIVEIVVNPLPGGVALAQAGVEYSDKQEAVEELTAGAVDPYVTEREAYEQNRLYEVKITCKLPKGEQPSDTEATAGAKDAAKKE